MEVGASTGVEYEPSGTLSREGVPPGQYRCTPPHVSAVGNAEPAGQKYPGVHPLVQAALLRRVESPYRPTGHGCVRPSPGQYRPVAEHGVWWVRVSGVPPSVK